MSTSLLQRSLSLCLAVMLTGAMLGGIHSLSEREDGPRQWAQTTPTRA